MSHEPRLPCPTCGYDLVGIFRDDDTARCPECGRTATLEAVRFELEKRAAWWHGPLGFLAIFVALTMLSRWPGITFSSELLDWIFAVVIAAAAFFAVARLLQLPRRANIVFAIGSGAIFVVTDSRHAFAAGILLWFVLFAVVWFLIEWRRIGDRW